jgi:putative ABC transport system substrate-binding protein
MKKLAFIYSLLLLLVFKGNLNAVDPKIMVINSDASVERYAVAQEEFIKSIAYPTSQMDLGGKKKTLQEIEDILYDEYPDLVYCIGTRAYLAANRFLKEKDIVFSSIINWQRLPVTRRTFGVSNELQPEMQIMLFRYIFPNVKKIGVLYSEKYNGQWMKQAKTQAKDMGVLIIGNAVADSNQTISSLKRFAGDIDALWLISDPVILSDKKVLMQVFKECDANKTPVFSYHDAFAKQGAVLIVSVDDATIGRQAAGISANVITGAAGEKVQYPAGSHIIMNLRKVKEYGLKYEESSLNSVNEIIE